MKYLGDWSGVAVVVSSLLAALPGCLNARKVEGVDTSFTLLFLLFSEETPKLCQLQVPRITYLGSRTGVCMQITKQPLQNIFSFVILLMCGRMG